MHYSNYFNSRDSATGIFIVGTVHFYRSDVHNRYQKAFVNNFSGVLTHKSSPEPHTYLQVCEILLKNIVTYDRNLICLPTDLSPISVKCYVFFLRIKLDQQVEAHTAVCRENVMRLLIGVIIIVLYIFKKYLFIFFIVFIVLIVLQRVNQYRLMVEIVFRLPITI